MRGLFKKAEVALTKPVLLGFSTHGCQATIKEFEFAGNVIGTWVDKENWRSKYYSYEFYYKVKITISHNDRDKVGEIKQVPAWYCTEKDGILIFED